MGWLVLVAVVALVGSIGYQDRDTLALDTQG